jgi:hypothetical protein
MFRVPKLPRTYNSLRREGALCLEDPRTRTN